MFIFGLAGGFILWVILRRMFALKGGRLAQTVFFVCLIAGLAVSSYFDWPLIVEVARAVKSSRSY